MDSIVKWYIEKALEEQQPVEINQKEFEKEVDVFVAVLEEVRYSVTEMNILLRALELAVEDIG